MTHFEGLKALLSRIDAALIPEKARAQPWTARKARTLLYVHLVLLLSAFVFQLVNALFFNSMATPPLLAVMVMIALSIFLFKTWGNFNVSGNILAFLAFTLWFSLTLETGGIYSDNLLWMLVSPFLALFFANVRSGLFWLTALLGAATYLFVIHEEHAAEFLKQTSQFNAFYYYTSYSGLFVVLVCIVLVFATGQKKAIEAAHTAQLRVVELPKEAMDKEMAVAKRLQEQIVPAPGLHRLPGVDITGVIETASVVGGDFWTYLSLPDGRTLVLLGDVTGHGVAAGLMTTVARTAVDTLLEHVAGFELNEMMNTLSQVVFRLSSGSMSMTAWVMVIDSAERKLTFVNAGHPHPFWLHSGPEASISNARGGSLSPPLGAALGQKYSAHTFSYEAGDVLAVFTDGAPECLNQGGRPYGLKRLRNVLLTNFRRPLKEQLSTLIADFKAFTTDVPATDDISVVMLRLT